MAERGRSRFRGNPARSRFYEWIPAKAGMTGEAGTCFLVLLIAMLTASGVAAQPVRVIFDTDLGPDADDAGALALLHALADRGEAEVLGVACGTKSPWCAPAADAINTYYGHPGLPVGTNKGEGPMGGSEEWYGDAFNGYVAGHFPNDTRHAEYAEDAVVMYRRLLAAAPDTSVAVVVVGSMSNPAHLLASLPDSLSPLSGRDLVARKVRLLSVMGGAYPEGSESNFTVDPAATRALVEGWPTPVTFSGFEIGEELMTGARLWETPEENPVRAAYHFWDLYFARQFTPEFDPETGIWPHSSFDQTAVLYAVRGLRDYWDAVTTGHNAIHEDGTNAWREAPDRDHAYLVEKLPREDLAHIIEDLMAAPPAGR
jgi:inosine-uridine nucleoside N-ribohydrolase